MAGRNVHQHHQAFGRAIKWQCMASAAGIILLTLLSLALPGSCSDAPSKQPIVPMKSTGACWLSGHVPMCPCVMSRCVRVCVCRIFHTHFPVDTHCISIHVCPRACLDLAGFEGPLSLDQQVVYAAAKECGADPTCVPSVQRLVRLASSYCACTFHLIC